MDVQKWTQLKNDITRRRFLELHLDSLNALPADQLVFYLNDLNETSARRIQAAWRGYRTRKLFSEQRQQLAKEKAAVTIQRQVRHWLHNKAEKREYSEKKSGLVPSRINEERLQALQQDANRWQENHETKFPGMKQLADTHSEVQNKLAKFYWQVSEGEIRQQGMEAR
ncbi:IQ calmodulin-binding motif-containing protein 1 [Blattella germanica]|nr:IQ calmodulin-binding motif-containing protein 1 [Blattella germanica]